MIPQPTREPGVGEKHGREWYLVAKCCEGLLNKMDEEGIAHKAWRKTKGLFQSDPPNSETPGI
jgi:hypothetical protein